MNKATHIVRCIFGAFYAWVGASWFVHKIIGKPWVTSEEAEAAKVLTTALTDSGIVDPLIASASLAGGLLLLLRCTVPLGLVVLAPLVTGIFLFQLLLNQSWAWGSLHMGCLLWLLWTHRTAFEPLWSYDGRPVYSNRRRRVTSPLRRNPDFYRR